MINISFPHLGPEALEAIRSCPAVRFIESYKAPPKMMFQATLVIDPPDTEKLKDIVLPIIYRRQITEPDSVTSIPNPDYAK